MALLTTHTNYTNGSYKKDRNNLIKPSENDKLYKSRNDTNLKKLDAHDDGDDSMAMGYGYDLFQNVESIKSTLKKFVIRKDGDTTKTVDYNAPKI
ncbi:hypothetical protein [Sulfurimonas sp.]|uniref:hypothetical protein n=1 Tax=Sulfurimonas sp. TaxID=2022749 RepID=UPI002B49864D|nr:hypothetical protein [Sulfurimonas sp.]